MLLMREIRREHRQLIPLLLSIHLGLLLTVLVQHQIRTWQANRLVSPYAWHNALNIIWATALMTPCIQRRQHDAWYDVWYVIFTILQVPLLFGWDIPSVVRNSNASLYRYWLPAAALVSRVSLIMPCNLLYLAILAWRMIDIGNDGWDVAAVWAQTCMYVVVQILAALGLRVYLRNKVELWLHTNSMESQLNATSSLLRLTCDAVIQLDAQLCIAEHSRELVALLLQNGGSGDGGGGESSGSTSVFFNLEGSRLSKFVMAAEAENTEKQLNDFRCTAAESSHGKTDIMRAHAFHTRLAAGSFTEINAEVLQVMYTDPRGELCHLVGLRDLSESRPYVKAPVTHVSKKHRKSTKEEGPPPSVESSESGSLEPSAISHRALFLDVDVEGKAIHASSTQLRDLAGAPMSRVFPIPHTMQLLERVHFEGKLRMSRGEPPTSRASWIQVVNNCRWEVLHGPNP